MTVPVQELLQSCVMVWDKQARRLAAGKKATVTNEDLSVMIAALNAATKAAAVCMTGEIMAQLQRAGDGQENSHPPYLSATPARSSCSPAE